MSGTARIPVRTPEDVWTFTQRNVPLWDILEFFPPDAIGPRGPSDAPRPYPVLPITIDTELGWSFESDIQFGSWVFRPRSPKLPGMMKWCQASAIEPGDAIEFERSGERTFVVRLIKRGAGA